MRLNFNTAEESSPFSYTPIPENTVALVCLTFGAPKNPYPKHCLLNVASSGLIQLPIVLTVACGDYIGRRIWERITMPRELQPKQLDEKQHIACRIGTKNLCSIIEAALSISKNDRSPQAQKARNVELEELSGLYFPIVIGVNGTYNKMKKIITIDDPEYAEFRDNMLIKSNWDRWQPEPSESEEDNFQSYEMEEVPF